MIETTCLGDDSRRFVVGTGSASSPSGILTTVDPIAPEIAAEVSAAWRKAHESPASAIARFEQIVEDRLSDRPRWPIYIPALLVAATACASFALLVSVSSLLKGAP